MSKLRKQERAAIEAVARHFSATWDPGEDPRDINEVKGVNRVLYDETSKPPGRLSGSEGGRN